MIMARRRTSFFSIIILALAVVGGYTIYTHNKFQQTKVKVVRAYKVLAGDK